MLIFRVTFPSRHVLLTFHNDDQGMLCNSSVGQNFVQGAKQVTSCFVQYRTKLISYRSTKPFISFLRKHIYICIFLIIIIYFLFIFSGGGGEGGAFLFFVAQSINEILYNNFPSISKGKIKQHVVTLS